MERFDHFMEPYNYDLGYFINEVNRVVPVGENPFAPKELPMSPVWTPKEVVERVGLQRSGCQDAWQAQSTRKVSASGVGFGGCNLVSGKWR
jgi:hypothetical protein